MYYDSYFGCILKTGKRVVGIGKNGMTIIGINGPDASGKTTFAAEYASYLRTTEHAVDVVHVDDFLGPGGIRDPIDDPVESYYKHAFYFHRLLKLLQDISESHLGSEIIYGVYDPRYDKISSEKRVKATDNMIIIVEGVLLFRPCLTEMFDIKIYLDADYDTIETRVFKRDYDLFGAETLRRYKEKYFKVHEKYVNEYDPKGVADFIF